MAQMTIQLRVDPQSGKKDIIVSLRGDDESLPHEHEQLHRKLVEKLIQGGLLTAAEVGQIIVERESEEGTSAPAGQGSTAAEETSQRPSLSQ